jgi:hypothetical protein
MHKKTAETNLIFTSMIGLENPPRPEVAGARQKCRRGKRIIMITGDGSRPPFIIYYPREKRVFCSATLASLVWLILIPSVFLLLFFGGSEEILHPAQRRAHSRQSLFMTFCMSAQVSHLSLGFLSR